MHLQEDGRSFLRVAGLCVMCEVNMELLEQIQNAIDISVEKGEAAGVGVLVCRYGKEILFSAGGYRDIENKKPIEKDTIYRMYSMSKPVTGAAAVILASEGAIDLAADVAEYLPEFKVQMTRENGVLRPVKRRMTFKDLLNMTSGTSYPSDENTSGIQAGKVFYEIDKRLYTDDPVTTKEFSMLMSKNELAFDPGSRFRYGTGADIMGALIERVSGISFGEYLRTRLFEPLGMEDTGFYVPENKRDRLSKVYEYSEDGLKENRTDHLGMRYMREVPAAFESGGAGICSTLEDYAKFASMLINDGEYNGKQVMSKAAVRYFTHGGIEKEQRRDLWNGWDWTKGYGYGNLMRVCEDESLTTLFSSKGEYGWDGWLGTFFSNEPQHGITYLLGVQQIDMSKTGILTRRIKNMIMSALT